MRSSWSVYDRSRDETSPRTIDSSSPARRSVRSIPSDRADTSALTAWPIERTRPSAIASGSVSAMAASVNAAALARISRARTIKVASAKKTSIGRTVSTATPTRPGTLIQSPIESRRAISGP